MKNLNHANLVQFYAVVTNNIEKNFFFNRLYKEETFKIDFVSSCLQRYFSRQEFRVDNLDSECLSIVESSKIVFLFPF